MNKFRKELYKSTAGNLTRAEMLENATKNIFEKKLIDARDVVNRLKIQYDEVSDIYPNTTMSTSPTNDNFNPENWVDKIVDLKHKMYIAEVKLKTTEEAYNEWFSEKESVSE